MSSCTLNDAELRSTKLSVVRDKITTASLEDKKSTIDAAIANLFRQVCSLRTLRNAQTAWISLLPTEIFCKVLVEVVLPNQNADYQTIPWKTLVQYTSVCRDWREMLLACPAYWAGLFLLPCKRLEEMVARSGKVPVVVRLNLSGMWGGDGARAKLFEVLPKLTDRLAEFHYKSSAFDPFTGEKLWAILPKGEAKHLRSFKLSLSTSETAPEIPTSILSCAWPVLQHLALGGCQIDWDALKSAKGSRVGIQNLASLHLRQIQPPPPRDIILSILRGSPRLEALHLEQVIQNDFDSPESIQKDSTPIRFRSLAKFYLSDHLPLCVALLDMLRLPRDVHFTFIALASEGYCALHQFNMSRVFKERVPNLLKQYMASIGCPDTRGSTALHLKGHNCGDMLCNEASCILSKVENEQRVETIHLQGTVSGFLPMQQRIHAPRLTRLEISWSSGNPDQRNEQGVLPSTKDWRAFFKRHPLLEHISFMISDGFPMGPVLKALLNRPPAGKGKKPSKYSPILPNLCTLSFDGVEFTDESFGVLYDFIVERCDDGNPLLYVDFGDCEDLDEGLMEDLRTEAEDTDIMWEGFEDTDDEFGLGSD